MLCTFRAAAVKSGLYCHFLLFMRLLLQVFSFVYFSCACCHFRCLLSLLVLKVWWVKVDLLCTFYQVFSFVYLSCACCHFRCLLSLLVLKVRWVHVDLLCTFYATVDSICVHTVAVLLCVSLVFVFGSHRPFGEVCLRLCTFYASAVTSWCLMSFLVLKVWWVHVDLLWTFHATVGSICVHFVVFLLCVKQHLQVSVESCENRDLWQWLYIHRIIFIIIIKMLISVFVKAGTDA